MLSFRSLARTMLVAAILAARPGFGAPALTTIQDVLYRADGTRFSGTLYITWTNFQSGDNTIPSQGITIPVVNGAFRTQLTPTTTASPGANYSVVYSSQGKYQFSEVWSVPPTTFTLRVRDVRVSSGSQVGPPPPVLSQILISDVTGLSAELATRPAMGVAFQPARTAIINSAGQLDAATGNLSDCIRVDGTSTACGSGGSGSSPAFVDAETPAGLVDGTSPAFTLQSAPSPGSSLALYRNGLLMRSPIDYTLDTNHITFVPAAVPQPGDVLVASYRVSAASGAIATSLVEFPAPEVICSSAGAETAAGRPSLVSTCVIPASHIGVGDRFDISYDFAHTGSQSSVTVSVAWGASTVAAIAAAAGDPRTGGKTSIGIGSTGAQWSTQTLGAGSIDSGLAVDSINAGITLRFTGTLDPPTTDVLALQNFTVVRYPAAMPH